MFHDYAVGNGAFLFKGVAACRMLSCVQASLEALGSLPTSVFLVS